MKVNRFLLNSKTFDMEEKTLKVKMGKTSNLSPELELALNTILESDFKVDIEKREIVLLIKKGTQPAELKPSWDAFKQLGVSNFKGKDGKQRLKCPDDVEYIFQCLEYAAAEFLKSIDFGNGGKDLHLDFDEYTDKVSSACDILGWEVNQNVGGAFFVDQNTLKAKERLKNNYSFPWEEYEYNC